MNLADGVILFIIAVSALISVRRGFMREAFSLVTWVAAFVVARLFGPGLEVMLESSIDTPSVRMAVAFGSLFAATLIVGALINHLLGELVRVTGLSGTDRLFGMVFGAVRGMVVVIVLVALAGPMFVEDAWWQQSMLVPQFAMMEDWSRQLAEEFVAFLMNIG
ncbi:CvpA family protein [Alcanivorax sp. JB21]|uniref:CvpA family protein n=1 Tax=Alcanivorax limicola TaxID=2874102 RepID=UPI001CBC46E9|nr:CvpA family protein [Alcanivorax limicola]MBZ2187679.1 CvpA family protein [Alcanivorax limicola]